RITIATSMAGRGTDITLHLREDEDEFLEGYRLRGIIGKFSDHVAMPVEMLEELYGEDAEEKEPGWEQVNRGTALWMRNKSDISDEEYSEFYKHIGHDFEDPMAHVHNRVEGKHEYTSLLYIPARAPFDMWDRDQKHGVKLYVRRVFIMDEADKLMPHYLRFVKGVVDSDDLPLNVSREILQHDKKIDAIRGANTKRILGLLEKMARDDQEKYQQFWDQFGQVLKEGPVEDYANREKIGSLLRFATTRSEGREQTVSLDQYIGRMPEKQEKIYYITADSHAAALHSPHLEVFKRKDVEVLLLTDRVDEWLVSQFTEYKGKHIQSVAKGQLDLGALEDAQDKEELEKAAEEHKGLVERVAKVLDGQIKEVRISNRLTESPACLVVGDYDMSANLQRVLRQMGQEAPSVQPIFEINPGHPLVERMDQEPDEDRFADLARILFDQAKLAEGGQLEDPAGFVHRLNKLMLSLSA
ncbi:MAG: molecular chaperone HtpG, partial [Candidatus Sedimenticola endophacoides]